MSQVKLQESIVTSSRPAAAGQSAANASKKARQSRKGFYASGLYASRATSGVSSRKSGEEKGVWSKYPRLPNDQGGEDTPKPLLEDDKKVSYDTKETPSELASQSQSSQLQLQPEKSSIGLGSRSIQSSSVVSIGSDYGDDYGDRGSVDQLHWTEMKTLRDQMESPLTEADLEADVDIEISETDTIWLLDIKPKLVNPETDGDLAELIKQRNEAYKALLADKVGNDKYVAREMNTLEATKMTKPCQTDEIGRSEFGNTASGWDMFDSFQAQLEKEKADRFEKKTDEELAKEAEQQQGDDPLEDNRRPLEPTSKSPAFVGRQSTTPSVLDSEFGTVRESVAMTAEEQAQLDAILTSPKLKQTLFIIERAVVQNNSQNLLATYRHLPIIELDKTGDSEAEASQALLVRQKSGASLSPHLAYLWRYSCPAVKGQAVTCMVWNKQNKDILAVSYGKHEYEPEMKNGLVCCWSVKNIQQPERVFRTKSGVTALSWSTQFSYLLAAGLFDGHVLIFDVRTGSQEPVFDSYLSPGRHFGPVRQLEWVRKEAGKHEETQEVLVSASSDGRVIQWSIRKGFEFKELMKLKRVTTVLPGPSQKQKQQKADALISRQASGSSMAFNPNDKNVYLVGTEDGNLHKCSCSYNEQYLESYFGHSSPVYSVKWSPFLTDVFISCAADWTINLWQADRTRPVTTMGSSTKSINSLSWSPKSSCIFACVNDGQLEVWNMAHSTLDPIITEPTDEDTGRYTHVLFSDNSDSLLVGDAQGNVQVFKLENMPSAPKNQAEALDRVIQLALKTELNASQTA
ncbi:hypothetical protein BOX15_Mlig012776g3 [Macrostomum lignano]|uniref:Dynein axonemal intermediate chain 4 n=1 Tax=Macrostomum lignano TaxID=282301 RepID=A0A267FEY9_9PLAT|nr:hypothetical protein BOX15_Mlig012776g1 [Macrostomum lignano]PAA76583.1 hypothetical protein BOX15_Mlig012776g3 [Macrostomum lignano]